MRQIRFGQVFRVAAFVMPALLLTAGSFAQQAPEAAPAATPAAHGLPLPVHMIEGGGGGAITPIAYPVNAGPADQLFGLPAVSFTHLQLRSKEHDSIAITETLYGKIELGYNAARLDLGTLQDDLFKATGADIGDDLYMHAFTARATILPEKTFCDWTPNVMVGTSFKYNDGINRIDDRLGGALTGIGLDKNWGFDFTVTASKTFGDVFGRPLILTGGVRFSEAAWIGLMGFTDQYQATAEANVVYLITDKIFIAYEYRQMPDALGTIGGLVQKSSDWHTLDVGIILGDRLTLTGLYGYLGNIANEDVNAGWAIQLKYEF